MFCGVADHESDNRISIEKNFYKGEWKRFLYVLAEKNFWPKVKIGDTNPTSATRSEYSKFGNPKQLGTHPFRGRQGASYPLPRKNFTPPESPFYYR